MSVKPVSILGGESVYCINQGQIAEARRLVEATPALQSLAASIERDTSRNERAALAFVLIERLRSVRPAQGDGA